MPGFHVVPQHLVEQLGPALSSNPNTGAAIAEQLLRDPAAGDIVQKILAGEALTARERVQLPPLMPGYTWDTMADSLFQAQNAFSTTSSQYNPEA